MTVRGNCTIDGCTRLHYGRGWCNAHYRRWRRTGSPLPQPKAPRLCSLDGCSRAHYAKTLCEMHYQRVQLNGTTDRASNGRWTGDDVTYGGMHQRVKYQRGAPSLYPCVGCGNGSKDWAYDHEDPNEIWASDHRGYQFPISTDPAHYQPMCGKCHKDFDTAHRTGAS